MKDQCVICGKNGPVWDHLDDMCHDCTHDELERVRKEREQFKAKLDNNERLERHLQLAEARLDWLDDNATYHGGGSGGVWQFRIPLDTELPFRACLDLAMKEKP